MDEENKLLKAAEGYKGTSNIRWQLLREAVADGFSTEEATQLVNKVLKRLNNTESGETGNAFGKVQDPIDRWAKLRERIAQLRSF
jgi:HEAT repeat protein